jgi:hypothetical protein
MACPYLCCRSGAVQVCVVVELLELLQRRAWLLGQSNNDSLAAVVSDRQSRRRALLWWLEKIINAVAVDLEVFQGDLNLRGAGCILLDLLASPVYGAQQPWDDTALRQRLPSPHRVGLAGAGAAVGEYRQVKAIEELLYRGRD